MKTSVITFVIGIIIFLIGYFVWGGRVGLSMQLAYCVGIFVGLIAPLFEE